MADQKYTNKVIEVINNATAIAKKNDQPSVDVPHLLRALFDISDSFYVNVLTKAGVNTKNVSQTIDGFKYQKQVLVRNLSQVLTLRICFLMLQNMRKACRMSTLALNI